MNEEALRAMVREAIARQLGVHDSPEPGDHRSFPAEAGLSMSSHASHFRYALPGSGEACLIEPTVQCNHCGYCQSHGH
jgi:hypothetical protein